MLGLPVTDGDLGQVIQPLCFFIVCFYFPANISLSPSFWDILIWRNIVFYQMWHRKNLLIDSTTW